MSRKLLSNSVLASDQKQFLFLEILRGVLWSGSRMQSESEVSAAYKLHSEVEASRRAQYRARAKKAEALTKDLATQRERDLSELAKAQEESARHQEWAEKAEKDSKAHQRRAETAAQAAALNHSDLEAERALRIDAQEHFVLATQRISELEDAMMKMQATMARMDGTMLQAAKLAGKLGEWEGKDAEMAGKMAEQEGKVAELEGRLAAAASTAMATDLADAEAKVIAVEKKLQDAEHMNSVKDTQISMHADAIKKHQADFQTQADEIKELRRQLAASERAPEEALPAGAQRPGAQRQLFPTEVAPAAPPAPSGSEIEEGGAGGLTGAAAASTAAASTLDPATPRVLAPVQQPRRRSNKS